MHFILDTYGNNYHLPLFNFVLWLYIMKVFKWWLFFYLQILTAAYNVKLTTSSSSSSSFLHTFLECLRKLLHTFQLPWTATRRLDVAWKKRVATEMLDSLSAARLAKSISTQVRRAAPKCYVLTEGYCTTETPLFDMRLGTRSPCPYFSLS
jgi:hypothetical protein